MLLTVEPIRQEYFSCIDGILATMANYFDRPYALMFMGYMGFVYVPDQQGANTFGEKLLYGIQRYSRYALYTYHHVKASWHDAENYTSLHDTVVQAIKQFRPIGVYLDSFFCPWNLAYQKFHINHYVLVIGFDETDAAYICLDPYASTEKYRLPYSCLQKGFREYILFEKDIPQNKASFSLFDILHENLYSYAYTAYFENMYHAILQFASDLAAHIDTHLETREWNGDLQSALLFRRINNLGKNRMKFSSALHCLGDAFENDDLHNIASEAEKLRNGWDILNSLLFRLHLTGKESVKSIFYERLALTAQKEKNLSLQLIKIAENNKKQIISSEILQRKCIV